MKAKKTGKHMEPCGHTESPGKAKSRIKRFEQCLDYNHRLALTYASNSPGDVPKVPTYEGTGKLGTGKEKSRPQLVNDPQFDAMKQTVKREAERAYISKTSGRKD